MKRAPTGALFILGCTVSFKRTEEPNGGVAHVVVEEDYWPDGFRHHQVNLQTRCELCNEGRVRAG